MFAALHIPSLPMAAALRAQPSARTMPCAVLADGKAVAETWKSGVPLLAVNEAARGAGIAAAWPLNRALVRCPDLKLLARQPDEEAKLLLDLCGLARSLTPDLEITAPDVVLMDLCRAGHHRESWRDLRLDGQEVWKAAAATPDLAHMAVLHPATEGRLLQREDLLGLPIGLFHRLAARETFLPLLDLWGLRTIGDFMALPRQDLAERLGGRAGHWHDLYHGRVQRLLRLHDPPDSLEQSADFEEPVGTLDAVTFMLKRLLHALSARLAARHLPVSRLWFRLRLEQGGSVERAVRLPEPMADASALLRPLLPLLESITLPDAVAGVDLDAEACAPSASQKDWYGRQLPQPERWPDTLRKLEALAGIGHVGIPVPSPSHRADAFSLRAVPLSPGGAVIPAAARPLHHPAAALPLRRYRPAQPVVVASETHGRLTTPLALLTGPHRGPIHDRNGPFPSSGDWWEPATSWRRVEWDIELADHQLLRLAFLPPDCWQVEGLYG